MADDSYHHGNLREALIAKAIEVLTAQGVQALSLRALARDLGVSHAAPTRHFATKTDLLQAIAEEGVSRLIEMAKKGGTSASSRERLLQMSFAYVEWARQNPAFHLVLRNPEVLSYGSNELTKGLNEFADLQRAEISKAQADGWRADEDIDTLLFHLMSLTAGTAITATDPAYENLLGAALTPDNITSSLRLFLNH